MPHASDNRVRAWASSVTPFEEDGSLDLTAFRAHCRRLLAHEIGVYVGGSGSGEGLVLSAHERRAVMETAAEELGGRTPVRAMGVEVRTADEMVQLAYEAQSFGLDAMQIYPLAPGHSTALREDEIHAYYQTVLANVELPSVISLHYSAGYILSLQTLLPLLDEFDGVVGINYAYPDLRYLTDLVAQAPHRVQVVVCGVTNVLAGAALGCSGFLVAECNLIPSTCGRLAAALSAGRARDALDHYRQLLEVHAAIGQIDELTAIKHALRLWGLPGGHCRPPRQPLPDPAASELVRRIEATAYRLRGSDGLEW